jgi:hypothetical protein
MLRTNRTDADPLGREKEVSPMLWKNPFVGVALAIVAAGCSLSPPDSSTGIGISAIDLGTSYQVVSYPSGLLTAVGASPDAAQVYLEQVINDAVSGLSLYKNAPCAEDRSQRVETASMLSYAAVAVSSNASIPSSTTTSGLSSISARVQIVCLQ